MNILSATQGFKYMTSLLIAVAAYGMLVTCASAADKIKVYVDELPVEFVNSPQVQDGTTLVQLRPIFEALGIELTWDNDTRTIIGEKGSDNFTLPIGQSTATVNGESVRLFLPAKLAGEGHTMVPLRFVGEATGSAVGWHGETQTISVYSSEYMQMIGLTHEEAKRLADAGLPPANDAGADGPRGFYARGSADLLGTRGCRGMCWEYFFFVNDHQVLLHPSQQTAAYIDCREAECLPYEIKDGQLIVNDRNYGSFELLPDGDILVGGNHFAKHEPLKRHRLNGKYSSSSFVGGISGGGFASSSTFIFRPDGTFFDDSSFSFLTDGSDIGGDGSGVSHTIIGDAENSGRYAVINYSILLEYNDGTTEALLFFRPDLNDRMLKVGGRDLLIDDRFDPDSVVVVSDESPGSQEEWSGEPYQDKLTTEGMAEKKIVEAQESLNNTENRNGVEITLNGYQWAELDIQPDYRAQFNGFGDDTIIALTASYTVENTTSDELDLASLNAIIWEYSGYVTETKELAPDTPVTLAAGDRAEKLAVFLFPKAAIEQFGSLTLEFSGLQTSTGRDVFQEIGIDFDFEHPF